MVEWSSQTNTSPLGARAFSTPTLPGSVATIAEKAAGVMVNRITRPIWVRAVLVVSRMKAPAPDWRRRGGESRTPVPTADDAGAYARASEGLPSAPARTRRALDCSGPLPFRQRFPREPLGSTLVRSVQKANDPINKLGRLELFREVARYFRLRLHNQSILATKALQRSDRRRLN